MVFLFGTYPFSLIYQSRELLACSDNHQDLIFRQKKGLQKNLDKLNWPIRQFKTRIHALAPSKSIHMYSLWNRLKIKIDNPNLFQVLKI